MTRQLAYFAAGSALFAAVSSSSISRADGDQAMGLTYRERALGLGIATAGVGLSARRSVGPDVPVVNAELVLDDVPASATVELAYLYWVTYGTAGDASVTLEGSPVTGALIGTSYDTCWGGEPWSADALNRVYRADVTNLVDDNGSYTIAGFPSGASTADTQGAGLVVVSSDAQDDQAHEILLHDGAGTMNPLNTFDFKLTAPGVGELVSAKLYVGAGDGQADFADGSMDVNHKLVPVPPAGYWASNSGTYWDDAMFDVTNMVILDGTPMDVHHSYFNDCVAFAYHALVVTTANEGGAGAGGAGNAGAGGEGNGGLAGGEGVTPSGGAGPEQMGDAGQPARGGSRAGVGGDYGLDGGGATETSGGQPSGDGGADAKDDGGCGCRIPAPAPTSARFVALALALAWLGRRARRRSR